MLDDFPNKKPPQVLSLFCGAGGLDHGFKLAGFETALALDNCEQAVKTFNKNAGRNTAIECDLSSLGTSEFIGYVPSSIQPVGLIGGPPCQGFSRGNVFANPNDPRNHLPLQYASLLKAATKKFGLHFFVFENVVRLRGPKHADMFASVLDRLKDAGFRTFTEDLDASNYDVPQRRHRLFVVGLNKHLYPELDFKFPRGNKTTRTVRDALEGLPTPTLYSRGLEPSNIPFHPNHWTMVPRSVKFTADGNRDGRSFRQLRWNEISPTVAYGHREIHVHPDGGRRLSIFEAMLLQGFPKSYEILGTLSSQVTQVSNAVPPPMAKAIALELHRIVQSSSSSPGRSSTARASRSRS